MATDPDPEPKPSADLPETISTSQFRMDQLGDAIHRYLDRKDRGYGEEGDEFLQRNSQLQELLEPLVASEVRPEIPDYTLIRRLGSGAFGEVWMAKSRTGVHRAVKIIAKSSVVDVEFEGVHSLENLSTGHPNIIEIKHVGEIEDGFYYVMTLADGYSTSQTFNPESYEARTLLGDLERRHRLPLAEAAKVIESVLDGLDHLHSRDLLHRDIKPANIVFVEGVAQIADIGLVSRSTHPKFFGHTPLYSPPGGVIDRTGDYYCLARVLYEVVSGNSATLFPELPDSRDPDAREQTEKLLPLFERACADLPGDRLKSADEFRTLLRAASGQRRGEVKVDRRSAILGAVALAAVAAGAYLTGLGSDPSPGAASLQLLVADRGNRIPAEQRVPLASDSRFQLRVKLPEPRYVRVYHLSDRDPPQLVHETAERVTQLDYPSGDAVLPALPAGQTHSFIALACGDRPSGETVLSRLSALGPPPQIDPETVVRLSGGEVTYEPEGVRQRNIDFSRTEIEKLNLLYALEEAFGAEFDQICAVAFTPAADGDPSTGRDARD